LNSTGSSFRSRNITPRKSLGQNFLIHDATARRIVESADIEPNDLVFEIGPGAGALTSHIAQAAAHVITIELDQTLIPHLQDAVAGATNVEIIHADALEFDFATAAVDATTRLQRDFTNIHFVANLPYYITSAAIRHMLECGLRAASIVLTVQLEVAQRAAAKPPDMSLLAVSIQFYGISEVLFRIPPGQFYPPPAVDSAVLRIQPHPQPLYEDAAWFFKWVKAGFCQPRKQLRNTLAAGAGISKEAADALLHSAGIAPTRRAETMTIQEWIAIAEAAKRSSNISASASAAAGEQPASTPNDTSA
jgi:16S rRNA (adenine1518-N6/adenine1519-N6)-dimethyltransferase